MGVPATVVLDSTILEALNKTALSIPRVLHHLLQISHLNARVSKLLGNNENANSGLLPQPLPIIRTLNEEFSVLYSHYYESDFASTTKILFHSACLKLFSFALIDDRLSSSGATEVSILAYHTSMNLVAAASTASPSNAFWTNDVWSSLVYTALFLLRLGEYSHICGLDEAQIRLSISQLRSLFAGNSRDSDDHMSRVCAIIDYLSLSDWSEPQSRRPVMFQSRMAASLALDTTWHAKERFRQTMERSHEAFESEKRIGLVSQQLTVPSWEEMAFSDIDVLVGSWDTVFE